MLNLFWSDPVTVLDIRSDTLQRLQQRAIAGNCSVDDLLNQLLDGSAGIFAFPYANILKHTTDIIALFDLEYRYLYANPYIMKLTGFPSDEMIGKTSRELGMPEHQVVYWEDIQKEVIETQQERVITFDFPSKNGQEFYESRITPILNADGQTLYVLGITRDITERRRAEEQLQRSEANLRAVLNSTWHSFTLIDRDYRIIDADEKGKKTAEAIFGKLMRVGDSIYDFVPARDIDTFNENFSSALHGKIITVERLFKDLQGRELYYEVTYYPVVDVTGETIGVCMSYQNITERKQIMAALSQSEARLRSLLEMQTAFVVRSDLNGIRTYANPAFANRYQWHTDDLVGHPMLSTVIPIDHQKAFEAVQACLAEPGKPIQVVLRKTTPDESMFWTLWEFVAVVGSDKTVNEIQCIGFDITEQTEAEQLRIEQERLRASLKKEREFNVLTQKVVSALAHDVRIPLAVIASSKNMLDRYFERLDEGNRREKLATIGKQLHYVIEMLDDVVMTVKGSLNHQVFKPTAINLATLCQISVQEIQQTSGDKHQMRFVTDHLIQTVLVDETLVNRMLLNLLSNAVKFSPEASEIRLELSRREDWIVLRVVDHGMGIAEANLPHIFEAFYRTNSAQFIRGTGLGLNIVKDCVERHHGVIMVVSKVGQGTTFTIELPLQHVR